MKKQYNQPRVETVEMEPETNILYAASMMVNTFSTDGMVGD